jgi:hypothetical protein
MGSQMSLLWQECQRGMQKRRRHEPLKRALHYFCP